MALEYISSGHASGYATQSKSFPLIAHRQSISSVRRFGESCSSNALFIRFSLPYKVHFVELCGAEVSSLTYLRAKGIIYNIMGTGMTHLLS